MLGPTNTNREPSFLGPDDLLSEMDRVGIEEALVFSSRALYSHPEDGNRMILEETGGHPRLHPCWVLLPPGTRELPEPEVIVREMREAGVRAARLFPAMHNYPFVVDVLAPLLEALAEARIPLFLDTGRRHWSGLETNWPEVFRVCETYPDLPLVLVREGGTTQRILYGRWRNYPNLLIETSYLQTPGCLEEIARDCGAGRLLFGTGMPTFDPGPPMSLIEASGLEERGKADVAGDNLRRLMGLKPKPVGGGAWPCGKGGLRVFDAHGHLGRWEKVYYPIGTADQIVTHMDKCGVEKLAVSDVLAIGPDFRSGNSRVGDAVARHPERLVGYAVYNPNYESRMQAEMDRCFDDLGLSGIKLHCSLHETSTDHQSYRPAFRIANERGLPILVHAHHGPSAEFLKALLADHPGMYFIYAHLGGGAKAGLEPLLAVANEHPNLVFDIGLSTVPRGTLAWLVGQVSTRQVVYGSDFPIMDFAYQLGRVLRADISVQTKRMILFDNAERIFSAASRSRRPTDPRPS